MMALTSCWLTGDVSTSSSIGAAGSTLVSSLTAWEWVTHVTPLTLSSKSPTAMPVRAPRPLGVRALTMTPMPGESPTEIPREVPGSRGGRLMSLTTPSTCRMARVRASLGAARCASNASSFARSLSVHGSDARGEPPACGTWSLSTSRGSSRPCSPSCASAYALRTPPLMSAAASIFSSISESCSFTSAVADADARRAHFWPCSRRIETSLASSAVMSRSTAPLVSMHAVGSASRASSASRSAWSPPAAWTACTSSTSFAGSAPSAGCSTAWRACGRSASRSR
mmetsp:Transcript_61491/g.168976  ORF Transcript_61491/g.168976 Transcript_61491/m.168976 type:complete len:283 (+) Transcript_61491:964-1812(+)